MINIIIIKYFSDIYHTVTLYSDANVAARSVRVISTYTYSLILLEAMDGKRRKGSWSDSRSMCRSSAGGKRNVEEQGQGRRWTPNAAILSAT